MTPVLAGLGLAVPLVMLTSSRRAGRGLARLGLLRTAEETETPRSLQRAVALYRENAGTAEGQEDVLDRLLRDPALLHHHVEALPPPRERGEGAIDAALVVGCAKLADVDSLAAGWASLTRAERAAVLGSREGMELVLRLREAG
jgi:membrane glycosyltransferase